MYEDFNHMTRAQISDSSSQQNVYLPHHPIIREHSLIAVLRTIFNGSSKTSNDTSINDHMIIVPKLQADVLIILS